MNVLSAAYKTLVDAGMPNQEAGYLLLLLCLICIIAILWKPYVRITDWMIRRQRAREESARLQEDMRYRAMRDTSRAVELRKQLEERERLQEEGEKAHARSLAHAEEARRCGLELQRVDKELQLSKRRLAETRPAYEHAMQMGHEVLAIEERDAQIRENGGVPPPFRITMVTRAVNQQMLDHKISGRPITRPAYEEYANHPCMR